MQSSPRTESSGSVYLRVCVGLFVILMSGTECNLVKHGGA